MKLDKRKEQVSERKAKIEKDVGRIAQRIDRSKKPHIGIRTKFFFNMMRMMHEKAGTHHAR